MGLFSIDVRLTKWRLFHSRGEIRSNSSGVIGFVSVFLGIIVGI